MKSLSLLTIVLISFLVSCRHEMRPLDYGRDNCELCRMTVMNPQFGAGMLTAKGKIYAFDAAECLVRYLKKNGVKENDQYFVSDYNNPGKLIEASKATFLHSKQIQSPMGGNLASFTDTESARAVRNEAGGELLNWKQLIGKQ